MLAAFLFGFSLGSFLVGALWNAKVRYEQERDLAVLNESIANAEKLEQMDRVEREAKRIQEAAHRRVLDALGQMNTAPATTSGATRWVN